MKSWRQFAILSAMLCSPCWGQKTTEESVTTGDITELIGEELPEAPAGYVDSKAALAAVASGQEPVIKIFTTYPDVMVTQNIPYTENKRNKSAILDLYQPNEGDSPRVGIVLIHGGAWRAGKKEDYNYYSQVFAHKGYVVANINYRLSKESKFPAAVQDCKCAVRWLRAHAEEFNVDPERIVVAGGSAGGHLSLLVGYASDVPELEGRGGYGDVSSRVCGVVSIYGPTDLTTDFVRKNQFAAMVVGAFIGAPIDRALGKYELASPIRHVDAEDPPTLILHGTVDDVVPIAQSDQLAKKLEEVEIPFVYDRIAGWPHAMDLSARVNDRFVWMMDHFFQRCSERVLKARAAR